MPWPVWVCYVSNAATKNCNSKWYTHFEALLTLHLFLKKKILLQVQRTFSCRFGFKPIHSRSYESPEFFYFRREVLENYLGSGSLACFVVLVFVLAKTGFRVSFCLIPFKFIYKAQHYPVYCFDWFLWTTPHRVYCVLLQDVPLQFACNEHKICLVCFQINYIILDCEIKA